MTPAIGEMAISGDSERAKVVSVLEVLATEVVPTGPNMSNRSTPTAGDADDQ